MEIGKSIRIKDIAKLAGVSVGTVDRVLHNRGRVSEDALQKVTAVMNQIDYKPNLIARTLGSNKNYRIAALIPDPTRDPYWAQTNLGIIQAQTEWAQYGVIVDTFPFDLYNKDSFHRIARAVVEEHPDGIVIAPIFYHESVPAFELFQEAGIPYVLFNTNINEAKPLGFIGQNLYQSGRVGAQLMMLGQRDQATFAVLHIDEDVSIFANPCRSETVEIIPVRVSFRAGIQVRFARGLFFFIAHGLISLRVRLVCSLLRMPNLHRDIGRKTEILLARARE